MKRYLRGLLALFMALALLCPAALAEAVEEAGQPEDAVMEVEFSLDDDEPDEAETEDDALADAMEAQDASIDLDDFELDIHELTLGVGEKFNLYPAVGGAIPKFESSDKKIAKVDKKGKVTGVKVGECTIYATRDGITEECEVTVMKAPKSITMNYKTVTLGYDKELGMGESFDLEYWIPDDSWSNEISLTGYNRKIVSVDDANTVTATGVGSTKITATTFNKKKATVKITVAAAPESMSFERSTVGVLEYSEYQLKLVLPKKTGGNFTWSSSDESVAEVDDQGLVTGMHAGTTEITAECFNGVSATCTVNVMPAPDWIAVAPTELVLGAGETSELSVNTDIGPLDTGLSYTTSNKKYATVSADGVVKAVKKGSATIHVKTGNGLTDEVKVKILKAPTSLTLNKKSLIMGTGEEETLIAKLSKNSGGTITWTSSNEDVAEVYDDGTVVANGSGNATITAMTYNKKKATCKVQVISPADEIILDEELSITYRSSIALPYEVYDVEGNAYKGPVTVEFDPKGIASIESKKLKGVKIGETFMTVTAGDLSATCLITVEKKGSSGGRTDDDDDDRPGGGGYTGSGETLVIAHRGGIGDSREAENTLDAFWSALDSGADGVELDVHSTKDGVQVINHDTTFKVGSKSYTISKLKFSEIRSKKPSIPTLDEALDVLDAIGANIHLEMKASANGRKCVQAIEDHGLEDRTIYFGFYETPLKAVHSADPDATLGLSLDKNTNPTSSSVLKKIDKLGVTILVANMAQVTEARVETLHDMGYQVSVWTPNTRAACQKFYDMGVDYILTDYPSYVAEYR